MASFKMWGGAGSWRGLTPDGTEIEVEWVETAYGDKGWIAWVSRQQVTEYPRRTRAEALGAAFQVINAQSSVG